MDCNNTEVFLSEWKRMCIVDNMHCPIYKNIEDCLACNDFVCDNPQKAIEIMQEWSLQNPQQPRKTRQSEILKHYPNARVDDGVLDICPLHVDGDFQFDGCNAFECADCKRIYWSAEVE